MAGNQVTRVQKQYQYPARHALPQGEKQNMGHRVRYVYNYI